MVFKWFSKSHPLKSHPLKSHPHGTTTNSNKILMHGTNTNSNKILMHGTNSLRAHALQGFSYWAQGLGLMHYRVSHDGPRV